MKNHQSSKHVEKITKIEVRRELKQKTYRNENCVTVQAKENCNDNFSNKEFSNHIKNDQEKKEISLLKLVCKRCQLNVETFTEMKTHDENNHKEKLTCKLCRVDFENVEYMDNHMDDNHEGRWKLYDPDVLREGDSESSSDSESSMSDSGWKKKEK